MAIATIAAAAMLSVEPAGSEWPAARTVAQTFDTRSLDRLLDLYDRDGLVYYAALKGERAASERFIAGLVDVPADFDERPTDDRKAFSLNAYNALVLRTVIEHYPIRGQSADYPANSIRQIPGAFDRRKHAVGGQVMSLDEIESTRAGFDDPRVFLALRRGAVDSGRLRSEPYSSSRLDAQPEESLQEFATNPRHVALDRLGQELRVSPIFD